VTTVIFEILIGTQFGSKGVEIVRSRHDRVADRADPARQSRRMADQRGKMVGKEVAFVFEVKFEAFGPIDRCAAGQSAPGMRKGKRGALEQKQSADPPFRLASNPETVAIAANEEGWNRIADDTGVERPELCRRRTSFAGQCNALVVWSLVLSEKRGSRLHNTHDAFVDRDCGRGAGGRRACSAFAAARRIQLLASAWGRLRRAMRAAFNCLRICSFWNVLKVTAAIAASSQIHRA
jgi:hypothetical protein